MYKTCPGLGGMSVGSPNVFYDVKCQRLKKSVRNNTLDSIILFVSGCIKFITTLLTK